MSGGVDSSVCAALLLQRGYDVSGVTLRLYDGEDYNAGKTRTCCSLSDVEDARAVCMRIGIPHYAFNFKDAFQKDVIEDFVNEYIMGLTPNPCIECNRHIKFDAMLERAKVLGYDKIATGHYASVKQNENGRYLLCRAADISKDQTYVLYCMTQHQLEHTLFPLYGMEKTDVRRLAEEHGLVNSHKPDSQDICFVPDSDYISFIERYTGYKPVSGEYVFSDGKRAGEHSGIINYTIGQRKGLGVTFGKPVFVTDKDPLSNTVTLGDEAELFRRTLFLRDFNLIIADKLSEPMRVTAKSRYSAKEQSALLYPAENGIVRIKFDDPVRAPAKGQACVVYDGDIVVGGGVIARVE